jgi:hypothetical protein
MGAVSLSIRISLVLDEQIAFRRGVAKVNKPARNFTPIYTEKLRPDWHQSPRI